MDGHDVFGLEKRAETEFGVEAVGIAGGEEEAAQSLEIRMGHDGAHDFFGDAMATVVGEDENIGDVSEGGIIGDGPGEGDLFSFVISAEAEGVLDGSLKDGERDVFGPIGGAQEFVDHRDVQAMAVGGDFVLG